MSSGWNDCDDCSNRNVARNLSVSIEQEEWIRRAAHAALRVQIVTVTTRLPHRTGGTTLPLRQTDESGHT